MKSISLTFLRGISVYSLKCKIQKDVYISLIDWHANFYTFLLFKLVTKIFGYENSI